MTDRNDHPNPSQRPDDASHNQGADNDATQVFHRPGAQEQFANDATRALDGNAPKPPEYHRAEEYQQPQQDYYGAGGYQQDHGYQNQSYQQGQYGYGSSEAGYGQGSYEGDPFNGGYGYAYDQGYDQQRYGAGQGYGQQGYGAAYNQPGYGAGYNGAGYGSGPQPPRKNRRGFGGVFAVVVPLLLLLAIGFGLFMFFNSSDDGASEPTSSSSTTNETTETTETSEPSEPAESDPASPSSRPSGLPEFSGIPEITLPDLESEVIPSLENDLDNLLSELNDNLPTQDLPTPNNR